MSRGIQNPKQFRTQQMLRKQVLCGASKAIWPTDARCYAHTNLVAQQRRFFIMKSGGWIATLGLWRIYSQQLLVRHLSLRRMIQAGFALLIIGTAFALSTLSDWGMVLHHWLTLLLFAMLCVFTMVIFGYLWSSSKREQAEQSHNVQPVPNSFAGIPASHLGQIGRSIYTSHTHTPHASHTATRAVSATQVLEQPQAVPQTQVPTLFPFPETPMPVPATPLVRVLETIDLSSTNIKHFLDTKTHSALTITRDVAVREQRQNRARPE